MNEISFPGSPALWAGSFTSKAPYKRPGEILTFHGIKFEALRNGEQEIAVSAMEVEFIFHSQRD
jgi:hypothetical protein